MLDGAFMSQRDQTWGMWLGLLAVMVFAITLPMTRMATGTVENPQLSAWFITFGRAALAGILSIAFCFSHDHPGRLRRNASLYFLPCWAM